MSSFVDILQGFANEFVKLRDRVDELERLETYYGVLDLNGYTLTLSNDATLTGNPPSASAKYIVQTADSSLSGEQALDSLATGLLKNNGTTGVLSIATAGTDYAAASHTHAAGDITSGTVTPARLGTGTASAATILHGDSTWSAVDILAETTGTLSIARGGTGATSGSAALAALGGVSGSGTSGQVAVFNGSGSIISDSNFTYNTSTNQLVVGGTVTAGALSTSGLVYGAGGVQTGGQTWTLGTYTAGVLSAVGYVTVTVGGTSRRLLVG